MANRSKQKGDRTEREIVHELRAHGLNAYRIPLSGAAIGFKSDVELRLPDRTWRIESKSRAQGFKRIYQWLLNSDMLVVKSDRHEPVCVLSLKRLAEIISKQPPVPTENVTHQSSDNPPIEEHPKESPSVTNPIDLPRPLSDTSGVKVNAPVWHPVGIAPLPSD